MQEIHPVLRDLLSETPVGQRTGYVLPEIATIYLRRDDMVTDMVQNHFKLCGISLYKPGTGMNGERAVVEAGFHSLRHTFVSMCREKNVPLAVVESIVGHSNPSMTRHYTHVGELAATNAVALLPNISNDAEPPVPAKRTEVEIIRDARLIAEKMIAKNFGKMKGKLLAI